MDHVDEDLFARELRVLIENPDRRGLNLDYAKSLLDRGVNVDFCNFGHSYATELDGWVSIPDWQRIAALSELVGAGYAPQIMLGSDTFTKTLMRRYGGDGYCRLTDYVVPTLKSLGVSDFNIRQMTVDNPARLLAR